MNFFTYLFLFLSISNAQAEILGTKESNPSQKNDEELKQTYEGNIRGIRALMDDLKAEQPNIYQKLKYDFQNLDNKQSSADTIAYATYGVSAGFAAYGIANWFGLFNKNDSSSNSDGMSFTPFLISLGVSFAGGWAYYFTRPSPQEYLDFTNKHNRINKNRQLQWNVDLDIDAKKYAAQIAFRF